MVTIDDDTPLYVSIDHHHGLCLEARYDIWFHQVWYQGGMKATVSGVVEDLKFKVSEGSDQNWCFPYSAQLPVSV